MTKKKIIKIPFDKDGNLINRVDYCDESEIFWRDNYVFDIGLKFIESRQMHTSNRYILQETRSNKTYEATQMEFERMIPQMHCGIVRGNFTFIKKGIMFSISLVLK